jgi:uncharacterized protein YceH (UPF0502 family)
MEPDAVEIRVVACLVEKQRTTPDHYPLSLNTLRLACNQSTNRDPVVAYDEATVSEALRRTALRGWTRLASGAGSRARKYRHLLGEALDADPAELALLAVLMLRGPQTPGELKTRTERLQPFEDLAAVHGTLERLAERGYAVRLERRPGQREDRYEQLLGGEGEDDIAAPGSADAGPRAAAAATVYNDEPAARVDRSDRLAVPAAPVAETAASTDSPAATAQSAADSAPAGEPVVAEYRTESEDERLDRLEAELHTLKGELAALREQLGG